MKLISRDEAVSILQDMYDRADSVHESTDGDDWAWEEMKALQFAIDTIEERKEGRWIDTDYINLQLDTYLASCSECGYQMNVHNNRGYFKYCPNCGAKMYEDDKDIYVPNKGE